MKRMTKEEEENGFTTRSLQITLIACVSTLAVCFASWWGDPEYKRGKWFCIGNPTTQAVVMTILNPLTPLYNRLLHAMNVLSVGGCILQQQQQTRSIDGDDRNNLFTRMSSFLRKLSQVGIMTVCAIVIPIPPVLMKDSETKNRIHLIERGKRCERLSPKKVERLRPVLMAPGCSSSSAGGGDGMKGYYDDSSRLMMGFGTGKAEATADEEAGEEERGQVEEPYMLLSTSGLEDRVVLLKLGLVPPYGQLRYLRTRNRFQALITFVQTLGFVFGLVQRLVQGLGVSPLEVFVSYYAIMALVNLGLDVYASASFQTTLLLSLSPHDFQRFLVERRPDMSGVSVRNQLISLLTTVSYLLITAAAGIYYTIHYFHVASSSTRLVFPIFFFQPSWILLAACFDFQSCCKLVSTSAPAVPDSRAAPGFGGENDSSSWIRFLNIRRLHSVILRTALVLLCIPIFACSAAALVLAIVGTVIDWDLFNKAAQNMVAWIIPHVAPN